MRERLVELLDTFCQKELGTNFKKDILDKFADYLIANGVIVTPCIAMVEQVLKDGKMDKQKTLHCAGKYSVIYVDKSKWQIPLIDITEQFYNDEAAKKRIQALQGRKEDEGK